MQIRLDHTRLLTVYLFLYHLYFENAQFPKFPLHISFFCNIWVMFLYCEVTTKIYKDCSK